MPNDATIIGPNNEIHDRDDRMTRSTFMEEDLAARSLDADRMTMMRRSDSDHRQSTRADIDRLVDDYRVRCLWFLRDDYYPATDVERLRVLGEIQRYGDRDGFRRASELRQWLSRLSNARSAGS